MSWQGDKLMLRMSKQDSLSLVSRQETWESVLVQIEE
jgi:hypothetical protein